MSRRAAFGSVAHAGRRAAPGPVARHGGAARRRFLKEDNTMKPVAIATAALAFGLCATVAMGQTTPRSEARQVGPVTGDPEKDSIGFVLAGAAGTGMAGCGGAPRFTSEAVAVGIPTGDPEKDSIGFLLLPGEEGCPGLAGLGTARP
jgi:hypothetical protein